MDRRPWTSESPPFKCLHDIAGYTYHSEARNKAVFETQDWQVDIILLVCRAWDCQRSPSSQCCMAASKCPEEPSSLLPASNAIIP